jgi:hypothetical protein
VRSGLGEFICADGEGRVNDVSKPLMVKVSIAWGRM